MGGGEPPGPREGRPQGSSIVRKGEQTVGWVTPGENLPGRGRSQKEQRYVGNVGGRGDAVAEALEWRHWSDRWRQSFTTM